MKNPFRPLVLAMAGLSASSAWSCTATLTSTGVSYTSIQAAFNASAMTDTITVNGLGGVCSENLLFTNTRLRTILQGINGASLQANYLTPAIDSRVKATAIWTMTIQGGSEGVVIQRNANAQIDRSTIQGADGNGIRIDEMASASITSSTIQNNGQSGIHVARGSSVNVGFNTLETPGTNTIQSNGLNGVSVVSNSVAYIFGNDISANRNHGVFVGQVSSARLSKNTINLNVLDGVSVSGNGHVQLGGAVPALKYYDFPNITTSNNGRYGISSYRSSNVEGQLGETNQLMGEEWQFDGDADSDGSQMLALRSGSSRAKAKSR